MPCGVAECTLHAVGAVSPSPIVTPLSPSPASHTVRPGGTSYAASKKESFQEKMYFEKLLIKMILRRREFKIFDACHLAVLAAPVPKLSPLE